MIRVVYRWTVDSAGADAFVTAWWEATRYIQQACPGARGSVLLKNATQPDVYIAMARWDSLDAWQASRDAVPVVPAEIMEAMRRAAGGPPSYEIFDGLREWIS
ncbi:MAG: antibiotic biosynthesis monooxygenase family protein [Massilia sp.]